MPTLTINGQQTSIPQGATLLEAIHEAGEHLPTLCHLDGLPPYGACRLCLVELVEPDNGSEDSQVVAACTHPAEDGQIVTTNGPKALTVRKMMLEFMLARCPDSEVIQSMAADVGLKSTRFPSNGHENELCVLCGLCYRVCKDLVGAAAIGILNRGPDREVGTPFKLHSESCIGCRACAAVCPTGAIRIEDENGQRVMHTWNTTVPLEVCPDCGGYFGPEPMSFLKEQVPLSVEYWGQCPRCRRQSAAAQLNIVRESTIHQVN